MNRQELKELVGLNIAVARELLSWVGMVILLILFAVVTIVMGILAILACLVVWLSREVWRGLGFEDSTFMDSKIRVVEIIIIVFALCVSIWLSALIPSRCFESEYEELYEAMVT